MASSLSIDSARAVLRDVFGHADFRHGQARAVAATLEGRDVSVLLPTGGGKSLCYQVPAVVRQRAGLGPTVVVSPLIALMDDQVRQLRERGVPAVMLHSGLDASERSAALREAADAALVYCSPERLAKRSQRDWLGRIGACAVAVDEAHCISEWGHDFRPDYRKLGLLKQELGLPTMAVTATATPRVAAEIVDALELRDPVVVDGDFLRPNLRYAVEHRSGDNDRTSRVAEWLDALGLGRKGSHGRAVVYAGTRKRVQKVASDLKKAGFAVGHYHAGRTDGARSTAQEKFVSGQHRVLVATTAFGMGIDLPDIRLVAHVQAPPTFEAYVQQAGRAGRDGEPADCVLLWSAGDSVTRARLVGKKRTPGQDAGWKALQDYVFATGCRQRAIAAWFTGQAGAACGGCDSCSAPSEVAESVASTRAELGQRRRQAREQRLEEDRTRLEPAQLDVIVDFVAQLKKPLGKRLVALGLRGSQAKPAKRAKLPDHPLHGALSGVPERVLIQAVEGLLADGRLAKRGQKYPTVWIPDKRVRPATPAGGAPSSRRPRYVGLERALRDFRRREARRRRWKPYVVFDDATLRGILDLEPRTLAALTDIRGMGPKRVERYGTAILELVDRFRGTAHPERTEWGSTDSTT
ncbi:MAG: ATP-dependent DNA helicase RecQ [Myxococcota bacterium]